MSATVTVSFVHGYNDLDINLPESERPALWVLADGEQRVMNYPFPRNPADFETLKHLIVGEMPHANAPSFKKLPRFGLTGLAQSDEHIFAGSWNAVYRIRKCDFTLDSIVTNHLMNDLHGIWVDNKVLVTVLTGKDTVVISDHNGIVIEQFAIEKDLSVVVYDLDEIDWRFVSKQFRGSTGFWHFNYVQRFGDSIWLTSRNANAFVVVDLKSRKASLRLMNLCTPVLLHDGRKRGRKYYFTSIDGKILIAEHHEESDTVTRERVDDIQLYNRDLVATVVRLHETALGREPNWCRGIDELEGIIYVSIDGRYDSDLSFGLLALRERDREIVFNHRLPWSDIGDTRDLRFVTGFDVMVLDE